MARADGADLPEVEIILEADVAEPVVAPWSGDHDDANGPHTVGHDRLADVVAAFGATLEAIRASQGIDPPRHNLPNGSGSGGGTTRIAQVVQATPVRADRVITLMREQLSQTGALELDVSAPSVGHNDVVFEGRLRMPGGARRKVELRIYPTTSGNLTVFELLPRRHWMPQTRRYLHAGVPAITALTDRIEELADWHGVRQAGGPG